MREQLQKRCGEIASVCSETYRRADKTGTTLSQSTIDEMEAALYDAGLDVIDTSGEYPAYLMTADRFRDFWQNVQSGKNGGAGDHYRQGNRHVYLSAVYRWGR